MIEVMEADQDRAALDLLMLDSRYRGCFGWSPIYLREHSDEARIFDGFMAHAPDDRHDAGAGGYDFSTARLVVDIGGGNGEALRQILARFPMLRGLVFDRDDVVMAVPPADRLDGRITVAGGSFFDRVPAGADVYLLIGVLHDWSDEDCLRILAPAAPRWDQMPSR